MYSILCLFTLQNTKSAVKDLLTILSSISCRVEINPFGRVEMYPLGKMHSQKNGYIYTRCKTKDCLLFELKH